MRVLLFVQTGDGLSGRKRNRGPKQLRTWTKHGAEDFTDGGALWAIASEIAKRFDRWWLVECENAEAGRRCIACGCQPYKCADATAPMSCRILASGGKP